MTNGVDLSGARLDLTVRQGDTFQFVDTLTLATGLTITAARIGFQTINDEGQPLGPVAGVTGFATVASPVVSWGISTAAETRIFIPGTSYGYSYEVTLSNGAIQTIAYGLYTPAWEFVT